MNNHNKYKLRKFTCLGCGKKVELRRMESRTKYCSLDCWYKSKERPQLRTGEKIKCSFCGKEVYKPKNQLKRAEKYFCSQKCANVFQQETKDKDKMRANGTKSIMSQLKKKGLNKLEKSGNKILNDLGIIFQEQVPLFDKFIVDAFLEKEKIVIQWDGEYWHNKKQNKQRDISQDAYLKKCGYKVLRYTDKQIKNNLDFVISDIKKQCSQ